MIELLYIIHTYFIIGLTVYIIIVYFGISIVKIVHAFPMAIIPQFHVTIRQEVQKCFSACGVYCSKRQYNIYIGSVPAHCSKNMNLIGYYYYSRIIANHSVMSNFCFKNDKNIRNGCA